MSTSSSSHSRRRNSQRVIARRKGAKNEISAISLFSGIGGLDLGAEFAGFRVALAIDSDDLALASLRDSLDAPTLRADLSTLPPEYLADIGMFTPKKPIILIGGPPCTAFSHAGFWIERKRNGKDVQAGRVDDYFRFLRNLYPIAFVMENVPGLLFKNHAYILDSFIARAQSLGYTVSHAVLNAAEYGVPQKRRRLFVVGIRGTRSPFVFPRPLSDTICSRSASWAISDLGQKNNPPESDENLRGKYRSLLPEVPPGDNYYFFTIERGYPQPLFKRRSKYWSFLYKLHPDRPAPTLPALRVTNNGPFHWKDRHLRVREIARLQTFPDNYHLPACIAARRYLGNAVPPLLSAQLFMELRRQLGLNDNNHASLLADAVNPTSSFSTIDIAFSTVLADRAQ